MNLLEYTYTQYLQQVVSGKTFVEKIFLNEWHELPENEFSLIHTLPPITLGKKGRFENQVEKFIFTILKLLFLNYLQTQFFKIAGHDWD